MPTCLYTQLFNPSHASALQSLQLCTPCRPAAVSADSPQCFGAPAVSRSGPVRRLAASVALVLQQQREGGKESPDLLVHLCSQCRRSFQTAPPKPRGLTPPQVPVKNLPTRLRQTSLSSHQATLRGTHCSAKWHKASFAFSDASAIFAPAGLRQMKLID